MSSRPLSDLLAALDRGDNIEVQIVDLSGGNPFASSDTYLQLMTHLARLNSLESMTQELFAIYTRHGQVVKAHALNSWYDAQTAEVDTLVTRLEQDKELGTADEIEEKMRQIDRRVEPALERIRGVLRAIVQRQLDAMMAVEIEDLIS